MGNISKKQLVMKLHIKGPKMLLDLTFLFHHWMYHTFNNCCRNPLSGHIFPGANSVFLPDTGASLDIRAPKPCHWRSRQGWICWGWWTSVVVAWKAQALLSTQTHCKSQIEASVYFCATSDPSTQTLSTVIIISPFPLIMNSGKTYEAV